MAPSSRRRARARTSTTACSPGARSTRSGAKRNFTLPSASSPRSSRVSWVLPVLVTTRFSAPVLPACTARGSTRVCTDGAAGTTRSISVTELSSGGVSSRTWKASRRVPAGMPSGTVTVAVTSVRAALPLLRPSVALSAIA